VPLIEQKLLYAGTQEEKITLLCIGDHRDELGSLRAIFAHPRWVIQRARTAAEAVQLMKYCSPAVVLCDEELADGNWQTVLSMLQSSETAPPLVVLSQRADQELWAEVLNLGGYDLLLKPFERAEVHRVVSMAWRQHKSNSARLSRAALVH